jgi:hypothetical protein
VVLAQARISVKRTETLAQELIFPRMAAQFKLIHGLSLHHVCCFKKMHLLKQLGNLLVCTVYSLL